MTKIMLVEDDKSLREIYGVRLLAEGYDIVSAGDGEEALAMAIKERPSLIVSDVMMPKISGFDMLDILRSTTETKDVKVIMMTALSSEEQRKRGESLGADRYLVKSQVGIEDVVRVVHEVLGDGIGGTAPAVAPAAAAPAPVATPQTAPPVSTPAPAAPVAMPTPTAVPPAPGPVTPIHASVAPSTASSRSRVIQPISGGVPEVDINALLDKEMAKETLTTTPAPAIPVPPAPAAAPVAPAVSTPAPVAPTAMPQPSTPPAAPANPATLPGITIGPDGRVTSSIPPTGA